VAKIVYTYGFIEGGWRRRLIFGKLHEAVYYAIWQCSVGTMQPLGIRRGRQGLLWSLDILALYWTHRDALKAGRDLEVIAALEALDEADG
jgi:hypothetical protein